MSRLGKRTCIRRYVEAGQKDMHPQILQCEFWLPHRSCMTPCDFVVYEHSVTSVVLDSRAFINLCVRVRVRFWVWLRVRVRLRLRMSTVFFVSASFLSWRCILCTIFTPCVICRPIKKPPPPFFNVALEQVPHSRMTHDFAMYFLWWARYDSLGRSSSSQVFALQRGARPCHHFSSLWAHKILRP